MRVYLAGPISGLTYDGGQSWRTDAQHQLQALGIDAYSPLRAQSFLRSVGVLAATTISADPLGTAKAMTLRDRWDVQHADMVLMNLHGAVKPSLGSMIELGWANAWGVPVVAVMEPGNPHEHVMVSELVTFAVESLEQAIVVIAAVLSPHPEPVAALAEPGER